VIPTVNSSAQDSLDSLGRYLLRVSDYRYVAVAILFLWLAFVFVRRMRYRSWPPVADHVTVVMGLFSLWGVLVQAVVFLMTKPPALELLNQTDLVLVSVICLVVVSVVVGPTVFRLFFPPEVQNGTSITSAPPS
jgi:hypothetical protein